MIGLYIFVGIVAVIVVVVIIFNNNKQKKLESLISNNPEYYNEKAILQLFQSGKIHEQQFINSNADLIIKLRDISQFNNSETGFSVLTKHIAFKKNYFVSGYELDTLNNIQIYIKEVELLYQSSYKKKASTAGRAAAGAAIGGVAGAVVGAASAAGANANGGVNKSYTAGRQMSYQLHYNHLCIDAFYISSKLANSLDTATQSLLNELNTEEINGFIKINNLYENQVNKQYMNKACSYLVRAFKNLKQ